MTTLIADPMVAAIPVLDNSEPLVSLDWMGGTATGAARLVRAGLAERLTIADELLPSGLRLHLAEGFRPASAQLAIEQSYATRLLQVHPELLDSQLRELTSRYVAPLHVAPHVAGAAVDLTLADASGRPLWMGTSVDATPEESAGACYFDAAHIDGEARENRSILSDALELAGLVNYPTEWWHWSFGDRYWAFRTGADQALYGPVPGWDR